MSFVGTRPEAVKYVKEYKPEYMATLLLPAGITSEASIRYKDEAELLDVKATSNGEADVHFYGKGKKHNLGFAADKIPVGKLHKVGVKQDNF